MEGFILVNSRVAVVRICFIMQQCEAAIELALYSQRYKEFS